MEEPVAGKYARWSANDPGTYAYLLGAYLGDGHIVHQPPNTWSLRISCDPRYPVIEEELAHAMMANFGKGPRRHRPAAAAVDVLTLTTAAIGEAFPQHGPGRKHLRSIVLEAWQRDITEAHPDKFIRGLIHTDGCRTINRFRTKLPSGRIAEYSYVRYFFSNRSADILELFVEHCALLGIRVTQSNPRNLTVSHRNSVAVLEAIVGPKR